MESAKLNQVIEDQLGTVEPGKLADLVIVGGDPLKDILDVLKVVTVIKDGRASLPSETFGGWRAIGKKLRCQTFHQTWVAMRWPPDLALFWLFASYASAKDISFKVSQGTYFAVAASPSGSAMAMDIQGQNSGSCPEMAARQKGNHAGDE